MVSAARLRSKKEFPRNRVSVVMLPVSRDGRAEDCQVTASSSGCVGCDGPVFSAIVCWRCLYYEKMSELRSVLLSP